MASLQIWQCRKPVLPAWAPLATGNRLSGSNEEISTGCGLPSMPDHDDVGFEIVSGRRQSVSTLEVHEQPERLLGSNELRRETKSAKSHSLGQRWCCKPGSSRH